jgi:hypothetical protein
MEEEGTHQVRQSFYDSLVEAPDDSPEAFRLMAS